MFACLNRVHHRCFVNSDGGYAHGVQMRQEYLAGASLLHSGQNPKSRRSHPTARRTSRRTVPAKAANRFLMISTFLRLLLAGQLVVRRQPRLRDVRDHVRLVAKRSFRNVATDDIGGLPDGVLALSE